MKLNKCTYFYPEKPVLISCQQPLFGILNNKSGVTAEKKYNGIRLQLHCLPDGTFQFWGRHGEKLKYSPNSDILESLEKLPLNGYNVFDGELRHNKVQGTQHKIVLYDTFIYQDQLLNNRPFWYRRGVLEGLVFTETISLIKQYDDDFLALFNKVIKNPEIEGLVLKSKAGMLDLGRQAGANSKWMWKVRRPSKNYKF
jgi:ATP-dependent DNA ligase